MQRAHIGVEQERHRVDDLVLAQRLAPGRRLRGEPLHRTVQTLQSVSPLLANLATSAASGFFFF